MKWLKNLFERIFKKEKIKLIEEPKEIKLTEDLRSEFIESLVKTANPEQCDGNGYGIIPIFKIKDMV